MAPDIDWASLQASTQGRRTRRQKIGRVGRYVRAAPWDASTEGYDIAVDASLRARAIRLACAAPQGAGLSWQTQDLRVKLRAMPVRSLVVLVVDASDSMRTDERMAAAKGAALALLTRAYQRRDRVAIVCFGGDSAQVLLSATQSVTLARDKLRQLPVSGATPWADGLWKSWQLVRNERLRDPALRAWLVVLTDGDANVAMTPGARLETELLMMAAGIGKDGIHATWIDTSPGSPSSSLMRSLSEASMGRYVPMARLGSQALLDAIGQSRASAANPGYLER